ncbi:MAG: hypothetical protein RSC10_09065 [Longicatena sp.]
MNVTREYRKLETGYSSKNSTEYEGMKIVYQQMKITESTVTIAVTANLMEEIMGHQNLIKACKRVISNKGSHGIDGMMLNRSFYTPDITIKLQINIIKRI